MIKLPPFKAFPIYFSPDFVHSGMYSGFYRYSKLFSGGGEINAKSLLKFEGNSIAEYKTWRHIGSVLEIYPIGILQQPLISIMSQTGEMLNETNQCLAGICRQDLIVSGDEIADSPNLCFIFLEKSDFDVLKQIFAMDDTRSIPKNCFLPFQANIVKVGNSPVNAFLRGSFKSHDNGELWWSKLARESKLPPVGDQLSEFVRQFKQLYPVAEI